MNLITSNSDSAKTMTLKEITDLIGVRHDKALSKVATMAEDPEFGALSIMDIVYNDKGQTIKTYLLNQRQSIAVASRLNVALLMRVIDRWQELESKIQQPAQQLPQNYLEALEQLVEKEKLLIAQAPKVAFVDNLVERKNLLNATQVAQPHKMSAMKLNKMLDEYGGVYSKAVKRGRVFCQPWIDGGFGEMKVTETGFNQCLFTTLGEQRINEILVSEGAV